MQSEYDPLGTDAIAIQYYNTTQLFCSLPLLIFVGMAHARWRGLNDSVKRRPKPAKWPLLTIRCDRFTMIRISLIPNTIAGKATMYTVDI